MDKPLAALWKSYCNSSRPEIIMKASVGFVMKAGIAVIVRITTGTNCIVVGLTASVVVVVRGGLLCIRSSLYPVFCVSGLLCIRSSILSYL